MAIEKALKLPDILKEKNLMSTNMEKDKIHVIATENIFVIFKEKVYEMKNLLLERKKETIVVEKGKLNYLWRLKEKDIKVIGEKCKVKIKSQSDGLEVEGTAHDIDYARNMINNLNSQIIQCSLTFHNNSVIDYLSNDQNVGNIADDINKDYACTVIVQNGYTPKHKKQIKKKFCFFPGGKFHTILAEGDITQAETDVLVCPVRDTGEPMTLIGEKVFKKGQIFRIFSLNLLILLFLHVLDC